MSRKIKHPCVNKCTPDHPSGLCKGCGRSLEEVSFWSGASADMQASIIARLPLRKKYYFEGECVKLLTPSIEAVLRNQYTEGINLIPAKFVDLYSNFVFFPATLSDTDVLFGYEIPHPTKEPPKWVSKDLYALKNRTRFGKPRIVRDLNFKTTDANMPALWQKGLEHQI